MKLCGRTLFFPAFMSFAALIAGASVLSTAARAQAASEYSPLPVTPAKPRPPKPAPAPQAETPPPPPAPVAPPPAEAKAPEPVAPAPSVPAAAENAPAAPETPAAKAAPVPTEKAEQKKVTPIEKKSVEKDGEKEKEKEKKKAAAKEEKKEEKSGRTVKREEAKHEEKEKNIPEPKPARVELRFASKLPPDDHGPRAIEFIGKCADNYDKCLEFVREQAEKIPDGDVCLQSASDQQQITERVRKFITLRPGIQDQAANRMITEALYTIYPCKRTAPERSAKKK